MTTKTKTTKAKTSKAIPVKRSAKKTIQPALDFSTTNEQNAGMARLAEQILPPTILEVAFAEHIAENPHQRGQEAEVEADLIAMFREQGIDPNAQAETVLSRLERTDPTNYTAKALEYAEAIQAHALDCYKYGGWDIVHETMDLEEIAAELTEQGITSKRKAIEHYCGIAYDLNEQRRSAKAA